MNKEQLYKDVYALKDTLINNRRWLHAHAEVGFNLAETKQFVSTQLQEMGYTPIECGKCGIYVEAGKGLPVFLLRADMDALPIKDETDLEFKSKEHMHACGHDLHTAMMLGAAKILKQYEDSINGTIRIMFQPSEETFEGALDMIEHGVLKDVSAALMMHVVSGVPSKTGSVYVSHGGVNAPAADVFTIEINGKGCHGSTPHLGIDALNLASHILIGLQSINARELASTDEAILTIGYLQGGEAPNAIAGHAIMKGTLRTFDEDLRARIKKRMDEIIQGLSMTYHAKSTLTFTSSCPTLKNDSKLSESVYKYTADLLGNDYIVEMNNDGRPARLGGSEDFAYISQHVPSIVLTLNAGDYNDGYTYPLHHPLVRFDEEAMIHGCMTYIYNAIMWINNNKTL